MGLLGCLPRHGSRFTMQPFTESLSRHFGRSQNAHSLCSRAADWPQEHAEGLDRNASIRMPCAARAGIELEASHTAKRCCSFLCTRRASFHLTCEKALPMPRLPGPVDLTFRFSRWLLWANASAADSCMTSFLSSTSERRAACFAPSCSPRAAPSASTSCRSALSRSADSRVALSEFRSSS